MEILALDMSLVELLENVGIVQAMEFRVARRRGRLQRRCLDAYAECLLDCSYIFKNLLIVISKRPKKI